MKKGPPQAFFCCMTPAMFPDIAGFFLHQTNFPFGKLSLENPLRFWPRSLAKNVVFAAR
jgi:hypothetical protein